MNPITEKIANMSWSTVIIVVVVLLGIWYPLRKNENKHIKSIAETCNSLAVALGLVFLIIRPFIVQAYFIPSESMVPTLLIGDQIMANKFIYRFSEPKFDDVVIFKSPPESSPDRIERDFIKRVIGKPGDVVKIIPGKVYVGDSEFHIKDLNEYFSSFSSNGTARIKLTEKAVIVNNIPLKEKEVARALVNDPDAKVKIIPGAVVINGNNIVEPYTAEDCISQYPDDKTDSRWIIKDKDGDMAVKIPDGKLLVMGDNRNNSWDARFWGLLDRNRLEGKAMCVFFPFNRIKAIR